MAKITPTPVQRNDAGRGKADQLIQAGLTTTASGLAPAMWDVYDNPQDTYAEQSATLPRGPLGILEPPEVHVDEELPPEALVALKDFLAGRLGVMEMALRLEALQRKSQESVLRA